MLLFLTKLNILIWLNIQCSIKIACRFQELSQKTKLTPPLCALISMISYCGYSNIDLQWKTFELYHLWHLVWTSLCHKGVYKYHYFMCSIHRQFKIAYTCMLFEHFIDRTLKHFMWHVMFHQTLSMWLNWIERFDQLIKNTSFTFNIW